MRLRIRAICQIKQRSHIKMLKSADQNTLRFDLKCMKRITRKWWPLLSYYCRKFTCDYVFSTFSCLISKYYQWMQCTMANCNAIETFSLKTQNIFIYYYYWVLTMKHKEGKQLYKFIAFFKSQCELFNSLSQRCMFCQWYLEL